MADYVIPKRATAFIFVTSLVSQADGKLFQSSPTIASGDFKISKDGAALSNLTNLPTSQGKLVIISLTAAEMTADNVAVVCSDVAGAQWCDQTIHIQTAAYGVSDIGSQTDLISTGQLEIVSPVSSDGTIILLYRGDDYYQADGRALVFTNADFPTLTGATVLLKLSSGTNITGTVTSATSVYFQLTSVQTAALADETYTFEVEATLATGHVATVATGQVSMFGQLA